MVAWKCFAVALLCAAASLAKSPVAGKWSCTNVSNTGAQSPWVLLVREDGTKLDGSLSDGSAEIQLSEMKLTGTSFRFQFDISGKPYQFEGKADDRKVEGKYSGEEASGQLRCVRPAS
jgi:hypothetical protein